MPFDSRLSNSCTITKSIFAEEAALKSHRLRQFASILSFTGTNISLFNCNLKTDPI